MVTAGNKSSHWIGTLLLTSCELLERPSKKDGFCFKVFHPLNQSIWATKVDFCVIKKLDYLAVVRLYNLLCMCYYDVCLACALCYACGVMNGWINGWMDDLVPTYGIVE